MRIWITGLALGGIAMFSLYSSEQENAQKNEENKEVVEVGKQPSGSSEGVKRRWTKRTKPGAPKARKATPSRKKVASLEEPISSNDEDGNGSLANEEALE